MMTTILAGLSLIDPIGLAILTTTLLTLVLGIVVNLALRARYAGLARDLKRAHEPDEPFSHPVLDHIVHEAKETAQRSAEPNTQAIIEDHFQAELGPALLAERFVRAATGLVIILGLLGTFYGLTLSIGKIVHLVAAETGAGTDITQGVSQGLTQALAGMAVAFSNSLVGVLSAVILTVFGVLSNVADRRTGVMLQMETYLDRMLPQWTVLRGDGGLERTALGFADSITKLNASAARFEGALQTFSSNTRDFHEFNAHLKDNIQRMSLTFADLANTLKAHLGALKPGTRI
jgi:hypothetical protein